MHDFRDVEDEEAQTEMTQFLKNIGLTTGALTFLALSGVAWLHTRHRRLTPAARRSDGRPYGRTSS